MIEYTRSRSPKILCMKISLHYTIYNDACHRTAKGAFGQKPTFILPDARLQALCIRHLTPFFFENTPSSVSPSASAAGASLPPTVAFLPPPSSLLFDPESESASALPLPPKVERVFGVSVQGMLDAEMLSSAPFSPLQYPPQYSHSAPVPVSTTPSPVSAYLSKSSVLPSLCGMIANYRVREECVRMVLESDDVEYDEVDENDEDGDVKLLLECNAISSSSSSLSSSPLLLGVTNAGIHTYVHNEDEGGDAGAHGGGTDMERGEEGSMQRACRERGGGRIPGTREVRSSLPSDSVVGEAHRLLCRLEALYSV